MKFLEIKLPKGFMNAAVTKDNNFIADTNDSRKWDNLKFPLPRGKWIIKHIRGKTVMLKRTSWFS